VCAVAGQYPELSLFACDVQEDIFLSEIVQVGIFLSEIVQVDIFLSV
jgi:hypothetical protein